VNSGGLFSSKGGTGGGKRATSEFVAFQVGGGGGGEAIRKQVENNVCMLGGKKRWGSVCSMVCQGRGGKGGVRV